MTHLPNGFSAGLIVGSTTIWHWQYQLIQSLIEWGVIDVREVIVLGLADLKLDKSISLLHFLDGKIFSAPVEAFEQVDISKVKATMYSYEELAPGEQRNVDVLINFSEAIVPEALTKLTQFGVLTPAFSGMGALSSQCLGIDQYLNKGKQVCLSVIAQDFNGNEHVLARAQPSFDSGSFSRNLSQYWIWFSYLWKQGIQSLTKSSDLALFSPNDRQLANMSGRSESRAMTASQVTTSLFRLGVHVKRKLQQKYLNTEQWVLLIKPLDYGSRGMPEALMFSDYHEISPPEDCFWADPFVFSKDGHNYVFFEELPFATERGHLSCMEVFSDGTHSEPVIIIREHYHLSYPNVFEYESNYYLIPESGDNGTVDLYRCTEFPYRWEHHKTLINNIHAYDSTLIEYDGRWWLFATVVPELGLSGCEALYVFHADSPISSEWQPHVNNPVVRDAASARPGGNFYIKDNQLYRVSQDCAGRYGAGVNINKVVEISTKNYQETLLSHHYPDWDKDLVALHTFNFNKNIAVADALRVKTKGLFQ